MSTEEETEKRTEETFDKTDMDEIENSEELEKEKRSLNEFHANNNRAQFQIFVQNMDVSSLNMQYSQAPDTEGQSDPPHEHYHLAEEGECIAFVERYKEGEYLAVALALSTFEAVPVRELAGLYMSLLKYLPSRRERLAEDKSVGTGKEDEYIAIDTILAVIGGKRMMAEDGKRCVGLGEDGRQVLSHMLEQFPSLKEPLISWLIDLAGKSMDETAFDSYQMVTAFTRIVEIDPEDARSRMFPQLYQHPEFAGLLGALACKLWLNEQYREFAVDLTREWLYGPNPWLWESAILLYALLPDQGIYFLENEIKKVMKNKLFDLKSETLFFVAVVLFQSEKFRTLMAEVLSKCCQGSEKRCHRVAQIYLNLMKQLYYLVSIDEKEMPLVACDSPEQLRNLKPVLEKIMVTSRLRKQLYYILRVYFKEISSYSLPDYLIHHLAGYIQAASLPGKAYRDDILEFLNRHSGKAFQLVRRNLQEKSNNLQKRV